LTNGDADSRFGSLTDQATRPQARTDDRLISAHCGFNQGASTVVGLLLPAQMKCQTQHHARLDCKLGVAGLPARGRPTCRLQAVQYFWSDPLCQAASTPKTSIILRPILYLELHLWDVVAEHGVVFVRHEVAAFQ
jgi:hypothetical protein